MHCPACEKRVYRTLRKFKGVAAVKVDMEEHQAIVTGKFKVEKLLKKLKEKTGKRAEIVQIEEKDQGQEIYEGNNDNHNEFLGVDCYENYYHENHVIDKDSNMLEEFTEDYILSDITLFSDENTNACIIL
ncbi:heavy metal-associated isoprenylated plant protein 28-like [Carex rostrata]